MTPQERIREQLRHWRQELINLSGSNRLLHFKASKSTLELLEPAATDLLRGLAGSGLPFFEPPDAKPAGEGNFESTDDISAEQSVRELRPKEILTNAAERPQLLAALKSLDRRTTQEFMDKGLWILYLGVGMLEWVNVERDEHERVQSPILLVPVALEHDNPQRPYQLRRADEDVALNPALVAKLEHDFGISLQGVDELEDSEPEKLFNKVRALVKEHPDWTVVPRVVLGTFSFHKEAMYRDLLTNEETIVAHPLIRALALKPDESDTDLGFEPIADGELDEKAPPEQMLTIRDADASQRQCIVAARDGRSFVMDGPPGTGKSQTIANVIAELLARGQTVLFVSEKAAALEVVQARLKDVGVDEFVLALHSHKTTRREVARELGRALTQHPRPSRPLEPEKVDRLARRRRELSDYALAVNEVRTPLGQSLQHVLGRIAQLQSLPQAPHPPAVDASLDATSLLSMLEAARALSRAWAPAERGDDFLWRDLETPSLDAGRRRSLVESLVEGEVALGALESIVASLTSAPWSQSVADAERFVTLLEHLRFRRSVPAAWLTEPDLGSVESRAHALRELTGRAKALANDLSAGCGPRWEELGGESDAALVEAAVTNYGRLAPEWAVEPGWGPGEFKARAEFLTQSVARLRHVAEAGSRIAAAFGLQTTASSVKRTRELADLGELAGSATPPEGMWLDPPSLAIAQEAGRVLEEHIQDYARHRKALTEVFADQVLELDLEGLCVRFESVHQGWRKLRPNYWDDRRTLAACTRSGRVTKDVLRRLRGALAWKKAKARLVAAEGRHGRFLGRYYRRDRTDFQALKSALSVAKGALDLVGPEVDRGALQRQLTHQEGVDHSLVPLARDLVSLVEVWLRDAKTWLGDRATNDMLASPIEATTTLCGKAASLLKVVSDILGRTATMTGKQLPLATVRQLLKAHGEFTTLRRKLDADGPRDQAILGPSYRGLDTNWEDLISSITWVRQLRSLLGAGSPKAIDEAFMTTLARTTTSPGVVTEALERWRRARDTLASEFRGAHRERIVAAIEGSFRDGRARLAALRDGVDDVTTWGAFTKAREVLASAGLATTSEFCVARKVRAEQVAGTIERAILEKWADVIIRSDPRLEHTRPEDRDHFVAEFRGLDREFVQAAAGRVIENCNARRPATHVGAAGIILFEAQKQKKHMPVPKLLKDAHSVVQAIKPCFMVSPLSVSQFLPPTLRFDAVIFDEASQVRPSDAINCIYRGRTLIVAGDRKQLPPTNFFESVTLDGDDEWEEEEIPEFESVLDLCQAHGFPSLTLRWHYRSQHEDLITFSNYSFYAGQLLTFPGAQQLGPDLGVELFRVLGVYRRGGARDNPVEARKVVERVLFHANNHPNASLGVVAFSEAQATAIEDALTARRPERPELQRLLDKDDRLRGFFVKNLETVQGDERDILIFSMGYGPDENGKFTKQLGPLSCWRPCESAGI